MITTWSRLPLVVKVFCVFVGGGVVGLVISLPFLPALSHLSTRPASAASRAGGTQASTLLAGTYVCEGTNDDGSRYRGTVEVTAQGETWAISWRLEPADPSAVSQVGVGLLDGPVLSVIFQDPEHNIGLAQYVIARDEVRGRWLIPGGTSVLPETWRRQASNL